MRYAVVRIKRVVEMECLIAALMEKQEEHDRWEIGVASLDIEQGGPTLVESDTRRWFGKHGSWRRCA